MKFRDYFSLKHILFAVFLFAILIPIAMWDSGTQINVYFQETGMNITSDKYSMNVQFEQITSAELAPLADAGEKVEDGYDNDIIRCGVWENDTWGEYYANIDPDTSNCVVLTLDDGRTFVFSCKDDKKTAELYDKLLTYLPQN